MPPLSRPHVSPGGSVSSCPSALILSTPHSKPPPPAPTNRGHSHFKAEQAGTLHKVTVSVVDGPGLDQRSYLKFHGALGGIGQRLVGKLTFWGEWGGDQAQL